ncbi:Lrp/AsnC family transcriptional regulator [Alteribacillus iranensis]|uniref:Transcriptional regulator, AsnC family n=1 Tax=Alteribacillus iranensis TaxID=930128 RepID=A0A1I2D546_9BACI|nr:Lrp/AsnC family transcriptional regulator [Alteribacillus iranensis]SFE75629.1 transcriptional regulator, AsnC family [Alteribacillus iranensis]
MELDTIDVQILQLLTDNARMQWKDIGAEIHMTGQAVGNRIKKLEDQGVIKAYSVIVDELKLGLTYTAFIIVHMNTANHQPFIRFIQEREEVMEAHRVSGEGCYHLKVQVFSQEQLNQLLNEILDHGNYSLNLSIQEIKHQHPVMAHRKRMKQ